MLYNLVFSKEWFATYVYSSHALSGVCTKLSPIFGFAKTYQTQSQLSIKSIIQNRCRSC